MQTGKFINILIIDRHCLSSYPAPAVGKISSVQSVSQFTLFSRSFRAISASASTSPPTTAAISLPSTAWSWRERKYKHKQKKALK